MWRYRNSSTWNFIHVRRRKLKVIVELSGDDITCPILGFGAFAPAKSGYQCPFPSGTAVFEKFHSKEVNHHRSKLVSAEGYSCVYEFIACQRS